MYLAHKSAISMTLLAFGIAAGVPAKAQLLNIGYNGLTGNNTSSGMVAVSPTGTAVSGNYSYYDYHLGTYSLPDPTGTSYNEVDTYNTSVADISSGAIYDMETRDDSTANVTGGTFNFLISRNSSTINFSNGNVLFMQDGGHSNISITGGSVSNLFTYSFGTATVSGGAIGFLQTQDSSVLNLVGKNLTESFVSANYLYYSYIVSGTLLNSTSPFSIGYYAIDERNGIGNGSGTLEFNGVPAVPGGLPSNAPVPEAPTTVSFGLLLALGIGSMRIAVNRQRTASSF